MSPPSQYVSVTRTLHKKSKNPIPSLIIDNLGDIPLVWVINHCRLRFKWRMAGGKWCTAVQDRDVERVVRPEHIWDVLYVRFLIDDHTFCVWCCQCVILLLWKSCRPKVPHWMRDLVYNLDNNIVAASLFCLTGLNFLQVLTESLVSLLQASSKPVWFDLQIQARSLHLGLQLHQELSVGISQQWSRTHRGVYPGIVSEFG
jgi:hypothetical protein